MQRIAALTNLQRAEHSQRLLTRFPWDSKMSLRLSLKLICIIINIHGSSGTLPSRMMVAQRPDAEA